MRDSLTFLAILLIVVLTAALVAPYLIDWNSHRAFIEAKLSQAAGTPVSIGGAIDVKLLPQPVIRLGDVRVGGGAPGAPSFTADQVDVSVALNALMRGDVEVADATLRRPRLDLPEGTGALPSFDLARVSAPDRFAFHHVAIRDGMLAVATPEHGRLTLTGLDLDAEADSLFGPFRASGSFGPASDPHPLRLSTGAYDGGRLRVKLVLDGAGSRPSVDVDGALVLPAGGAPGFDGGFTLAGALPVADSPAIVPWRLAGRLKGDAREATLDAVDLQAGADMRALHATGSGALSLARPARVTLTLRGPQLDLDTLAVKPDDSKLAPPTGVDLLRRLRLDEANAPEAKPLALLAALPFGLALDYRFDSASADGRTIADLAGRATLDGDRPIGLRFAAKGPDGARVALDGTLETGAAPVFRGRLDAATRDLPRLAAWLVPGAPDVVHRIETTVPAHAVDFSGTVDLSTVGIAARDMVLALDGATTKGTLSYTAAVGGEAARLFADLDSDAVDLDALPDLGDSAVDWSDLDLDLALHARAVAYVPAGVGIVDAGRLAVRLRKTGESVSLDELSADIGSARVKATGRMNAKAALVEAHVDAPQLDAIAAALGRLMPGPATEWLEARAAVLSPARFDLRIEAERGGDGSLLPTVLSLGGTAGASRVTATLKPDRPGDVDPGTASLSAALSAESTDGALLMRQLGLPAAAAPSLGAGRFQGSAHGSAAAGFETSASLDLAGTTLGFTGRARPGIGGGQITLRGDDLAPLLRAAGVAQPQAGTAWTADAGGTLAWHDSVVALRKLGGHVGGVAIGGDLNLDLAPPRIGVADVPRPTIFGTLSLDRLPASALFAVALGPEPPDAGSGTWPDRPFGPLVMRLPRTEVGLKVGRLGLYGPLEAAPASLTFRVDRHAVTLADITGRLGEGSIGGSLTLRRDGALASLSGPVSWTAVELDAQGVSAKVGGSLDLAGSGPNPSALVASLAGTGTMRLSDVVIAGLDPAALARAARKAEGNGSDTGPDAIGDALAAEFGRAPLRMADFGGPATLAQGSLGLGPLHVDGGGWTAEAEARADLKTLTGSAEVTLASPQPLPDWKGPAAEITVSLDGLFGPSPKRTVDSTSFANALQARAIARDQERIDIIEQDMRERAYFNRQLKAIEADQAAARERRAKEEAASHDGAGGPRPSVPTPPVPPARPVPKGRPLSLQPPAVFVPSPGASASPAPDPASAGRY